MAIFKLCKTGLTGLDAEKGGSRWVYKTSEVAMCK